MNEQDQRIAIAIVYRLSRGVGKLEAILVDNDLPDYLNDLNAINEAEKALTAYQLDKYICHLYYKTMGLGGDVCDWQKLAFATARQRSEAFLKSLSLWVEEPTNIKL